MSGTKSPRTPKSSPKTLKSNRDNLDKITYHPFIGRPELGIRVPDDAEKIRLFKVPQNMTKTQKLAQESDLRKFITRNELSARPAEPFKIWKESDAIAKERRSTFRNRLEADKLDIDLKLTLADLDRKKRVQRLHGLQAKKEDKFNEQAELLKQWHTDNPAYAGESATSYATDDYPKENYEDERKFDSSPPSFFDRVFSSKRHNYTPFKAGPGFRAQKRAELELEEAAKLDKQWKAFRAQQIQDDESNINRSKNLIGVLNAEKKLAGHKSKRARSRSRSGGKVANQRRKTRNVRRRRNASRRYK